MLKISFDGTDAQLMTYLRSRMGVVREALRVKMTGLMIMLQAHIVGEKLSGQMLQHRTGKLIDSVRLNPDPAVASETEVEGGVQAGGGPAWYARPLHDGTGPYEIVAKNKKALMFVLDGKTIFCKRVMHPGLKARPFMTSSLDEMRGTITEGLQEAANEGLSK
jgi:hypothetical protein